MPQSVTRTVIRTRLAISDRVAAVSRRLRGDEGASAVEYALMVGLIAIVIIVAVTTLGQNMQGRFSSVAASV